MDFSSAGWKDALVKGLKVALWVIASGAIAALIKACQDGVFGVDPVVMGIVNIALVALGKWVASKK